MGKDTLSFRTWGRSDAELLEQQLCAERNRWDIGRRKLPQDAEDWLKGGGFAASRKLDTRDAERIWSAFMAAMAREND